MILSRAVLLIVVLLRPSVEEPFPPILKWPIIVTYLGEGGTLTKASLDFDLGLISSILVVVDLVPGDFVSGDPEISLKVVSRGTAETSRFADLTFSM